MGAVGLARGELEGGAVDGFVGGEVTDKGYAEVLVRCAAEAAQAMVF